MRVSQQVEASYTRTRLRGGEVLLTLVGTLGEAAVVPAELAGWNVARAVAVIPPDQTIGGEWIGLCLRWQLLQDYIRNWATTTVQATLNLRDVARLPIPVPPLAERLAIASILGTLDAKIELNRRMNATLAAMARALFQSWFVDFDPVRAKAEGRHPAGMDAATAALFPDEFEETVIGKVPVGWYVTRLAELFELRKGISYKGNYLSEQGISMINLGCFIGEGKLALQNLKYYSGEYKERHLVHAGDLVLANTDLTQKRAVLGSPALVPTHAGRNTFLFTHHVFAARFLSDWEPYKEYVYFTLLQSAFRERAVGFATGTTVLALPADAVRDLVVALPGMELLKAFLEHVGPALERQTVAISDSQTLVALRDALLPKLLSGEIRVGEAERELEAVL